MFYKAYHLQDLEMKDITKNELSDLMGLGDFTFDTALPQSWLDEFVEKNFDKVVFKKGDNSTDSHLTPREFYSLVLSTTFWVYPEGSTFGGPVSGCVEVAERLPAIGVRCTEDVQAIFDLFNFTPEG